MNKNCNYCQKQFSIILARKDTAKFCSKACLAKSRKGRKNSNLNNFRKAKIWMYMETVVQKYKVGHSADDIALEYSCNKATVLRALRKYGITTRRGGCKKGCISWNKGKKYLAITGDKNPNWKGGITPLNQVIRHCIEYKIWVKDILKRDDYTCTICNKRGGNMEVDHFPKRFKDIIVDNMIKSYTDAQKCLELWNIENGRTLCLKCHNKTKSNFQVK